MTEVTLLECVTGKHLSVTILAVTGPVRFRLGETTLILSADELHGLIELLISAEGLARPIQYCLDHQKEKQQ